MDCLKQVYALAQYFRMGELLRQAYEDDARALPAMLPIQDLFVGAGGKDIIPAYLFLRMWYGSLWTVVEGWDQLDLDSPEVDVLLDGMRQRGDLEVLRRFRNAVFHYQTDLQDRRLVELLVVGLADGLVNRVDRLHRAFGDFFEHWRATTDLAGLEPWQ